LLDWSGSEEEGGEKGKGGVNVLEAEEKSRVEIWFLSRKWGLQRGITFLLNGAEKKRKRLWFMNGKKGFHALTSSK